LDAVAGERDERGKRSVLTVELESDRGGGRDDVLLGDGLDEHLGGEDAFILGDGCNGESCESEAWGWRPGEFTVG